MLITFMDYVIGFCVDFCRKEYTFIGLVNSYEKIMDGSLNRIRNYVNLNLKNVINLIGIDTRVGINYNHRKINIRRAPILAKTNTNSVRKNRYKFLIRQIKLCSEDNISGKIRRSERISFVNNRTLLSDFGLTEVFPRNDLPLDHVHVVWALVV